jgi:anti-sigma regulatory factor (Ser/Thr protein kinase)
MLDAAGVNTDRRNDAALVMSELVGNALRHARPRSDGSVVVRWRLGDQLLRIEVSDGGGAGEPVIQRARPGVVAASGRGLAIVDTLTQDWGVRYDEDGTTVWAVLAAPPMASRPHVDPDCGAPARDSTAWESGDYEQTG